MKVKKFLVSHIWWITLLIALLMLISHTLSLSYVKVDNISIILLVVMLLSPFTTAITKIKFGEFEAEINPEEVQRIKEEISDKIEDDKPTSNSEVERVIDNISSLVKTDPVMALARLRFDLEKTLNKLYRLTHKGISQNQGRPLSAGQLVHKLLNADIISLEIASPIREVLSICNRAIHGEDIRPKDAETIVEVGEALLRQLYFYVSEFTLEPIETIQVDQDTVNKYINAKYKVTTIVPLVNKAYKNVRIVDQEGLNELLEGYNEYGEFLIEVARTESKEG